MKGWILAIFCMAALQAFAAKGAPAITPDPAAAVPVATAGADVELRRGDDVRKAMVRLPAGYYIKPFSDKEVLLVASMGQMMTGGYSISIKKAVETESKITIDVQQSSPGPDAMVTMALTWPMDAAAMKKTDKPIVFSVVHYSGKRAAAPEFYYIPAQTFKGYCKTNNVFASQLINDEKTLKEVWGKVNNDKAMPVIDFKLYSVVAVCIGEKANGRDIDINQISTGFDGVLGVYYNLTAQNEKIAKNNAYAIAIIPSVTGKIIFEEAVIANADGEVACLAPEVM